ncbi:MAG: AAA family ATPase [Pirellulaceae bacterium]|nr:AAA family ATPase [Pirellulaceae bacterium]
MIRRIVLENYMSHVRTEIEPAPGLTVLIGPNNCGKSAVVSALQTLCSKTAGEFMVRHGQKECRVTIETDDGHSVTWQRRRGAVSYIIDGRQIPRGVMPDDLHDILRLPQVVSEDGNEEFDIHFGAQKSPIFLVNDSGRRTAMFFASSSDAEYLMRMQKLHKDKVRTAKREAEKLSERLKMLDAELLWLEPVSEISGAMQAVVKQYQAVEQHQQLSIQLSSDLQQLVQLSSELEQHTAELNCLSRLTSPPQLVTTQPLQDILSFWEQSDRQLHHEASRLKVLAELTEPPALPETFRLQLTVEELAKARWERDVYKNLTIAIQPLAVPPLMAETDRLQDVMDSLATTLQQAECFSQQVTCLQALQPTPQLNEVVVLQRMLAELTAAAELAEETASEHAVLTMLAAPPEPLEMQPLRQLIKAYDLAEVEIANCLLETTQLDEELERVIRSVELWTVANPICSNCGAEIDPQRLLKWGHTHA